MVDDGSTDDTPEVCGQADDRRLRVIRHNTNRGLPQARNTGLQAASGEWVLFGEDDCRFPPDYAGVLRAAAHTYSADVVGAPLLHVGGSDAEVAALAQSAPRVRELSMEDVGSFPVRPVETPFLPARALIRRSIFERVRFDDGFRVNAYREETDFFVQAARAGFRCLLTGDTYCYQPENWEGGARQSSTLRYEYWAARNNWRFLTRHASWLAQQKYIRGKLSAQTRFVLQRAMVVTRGVTRARIAKARHLLSARTGSTRH